MSDAAFIVVQSDLLPMMMATIGFRLFFELIAIDTYNYAAHVCLVGKTANAVDITHVAVSDLIVVDVPCLKSAGKGNVRKF
jgi:hypothetical protein